MSYWIETTGGSRTAKKEKGEKATIWSQCSVWTDPPTDARAAWVDRTLSARGSDGEGLRKGAFPDGL